MSVAMWFSIATILLAIAGLLLKQLAVVFALVRQLERVDTQINNGILHRTSRIEDKLDHVLKHCATWDGEEHKL